MSSPSEKNAAARRRYIRHPSDIPIEYSIPAARGREHLRDVSEGGLCFVSPTNVVPGVPIEIRILLVTPPFNATGTVVWCRRGNNCYEVGVKFDDPKTAFCVRMVEQICHIEQFRKEAYDKDGRALAGEEAALEWIDQYAHSFPR